MRVVCVAHLVGLVRKLSDDNSGLPFPAAFPLSLAPGCFACFNAGGSITATAVSIACSVPFYGDFSPYGYASSPIMVGCSDGIRCKNLSSCEEHNNAFMRNSALYFQSVASRTSQQVEGFQWRDFSPRPLATEGMLHNLRQPYSMPQSFGALNAS